MDFSETVQCHAGVTAQAREAADAIVDLAVAAGRVGALLPGGFAVHPFYAPDGAETCPLLYRVGEQPAGWDGDEYPPGLWPLWAVNAPGAAADDWWHAEDFLPWEGAIREHLKE